VSNLTFSIDALIETPSDIDKLRETLIDSNVANFLPILEEALFAIFECDVIDESFLADLQIMFDEMLEEGFSGYRQIEEADFTIYQRSNKRTIDILLNDQRPVIDSPYFGYLALNLCIESINACLNDDSIDFGNEQIAQFYGEASEAIAISRIASSYVNLAEEYYFEANKKDILSKKAKSRAGKENRKKRTSIEAEKRRNSFIAIADFAKVIWSIEPHIPVGIFVEELYNYINGYGISSDELLLPSPRNIKRDLKKHNIAPKSAQIKGKPKVIINNKRFKDKGYANITSELIQEKISYLKIPLIQ
jgi:hypothetical protein